MKILSSVYFHKREKAIINRRKNAFQNIQKIEILCRSDVNNVTEHAK